MRDKLSGKHHDASDRAVHIGDAVKGMADALDELGFDDARIALRWLCELRGISVANLNHGRGD